MSSRWLSSESFVEWRQLIDRETWTSMRLSSTCTHHVFRNLHVHVKRDDELYLAGNKMRKLGGLLQQDDTFYQDKHIVSYGGTQSNAMLAIAQLAQIKKTPFTYFSRALHRPGPSSMRRGNLDLALDAGMDHVELSDQEYRDLSQSRDFHKISGRYRALSDKTQTLYVPQGGAFPQAQIGVQGLADELNEYISNHGGGNNFAVVLPSGTGTTALYLAQHLDADVKLYTVPCVGDATYLHAQWKGLVDQDVTLIESRMRTPEVLVPKAKSTFGRLSWPLYDIYHEILEEAKLEIDLLYGCFTWHTLFNDERALSSVLEAGQRSLLYIHTGGLSGNATMLERYERKGR